MSCAPLRLRRWTSDRYERLRLQSRAVAQAVPQRLATDWSLADLDRARTKRDHKVMDQRDCLAFYPFVVVRIACRVCSRRGSYRLARLAAKIRPGDRPARSHRPLLLRLPMEGRSP